MDGEKLDVIMYFSNGNTMADAMIPLFMIFRRWSIKQTKHTVNAVQSNSMAAEEWILTPLWH